MRLLLIFLPLLLCLTTASFAAPKPFLLPDLSGDDWVQRPVAPLPKVIYGSDDRLDVYQVSDSQLLAWAAATCALIPNNRISDNGDDTYTIHPAEYRVSGYPACPTEPFGDQPVAGFCSGAWLGDDLVSSAGHCLDAGTLGNFYFVFAFNMLDANTPMLVIPENQVYRGVSVVRRVLNNSTGEDYAVVELDRPVSIPGVNPIEIRRSGEIAPGEPVGVIGHPAGLPKKIAFGSTTAVRSNNSSMYFVANLDTYGGNSGSPVFNPVTGLMEGVLVRGETDYVINQAGGCFLSNIVSDTGGSGEDCTKVARFVDLIPEPITNRGKVFLNQSSYACGAQIVVSVNDLGEAGTGSVAISLSTQSGDAENLELVETPVGSGVFSGTINTANGAAQPGNQTLESNGGDTVTAVYTDQDYDGAGVQDISAQATLDCQAPNVLDARITALASGQGVFYVESDEAANAVVYFGSDCTNPSTSVSSSSPRLRQFLPTGCLQAGTTYEYSVDVSDAAGNITRFPAQGCSSFTTPSGTSDYHAEYFDTSFFDLNGKSLTFYPKVGGMDYWLCIDTVGAYPTDPTGGQTLFLNDDDSQQFTLSAGAPDLPFFDVAYRAFHINSNGNITFGSADAATWQESLAEHFRLRRISMFFDDLNPVLGGTVSVKELSDRVAVTFNQIRPYGQTNLNSFQAELFFSGIIRLHFISITSQNGLVGLSRGAGTPCVFAESDLSAGMNCNDDADNDGLSNYDEFELGSDPHDPDSDGDGMPDGWEVAHGLDPLDNTGVNGASGDLDGDGLSNLFEYNLGTEVNNADTDNDLLPDGWEYLTGLDPLDNVGDNGTYGDPDGDNLTNLQEYQMGTLPLVADSDGDGLNDDIDPVPDGSDERHSADINEDLTISLSELLRVIQLFNLGVFSCDINSEDGYAPGTGDQGCESHKSDFITQNWIFELSEILRLIQLFNAFSYKRDLLSEDGFAPDFST